jgi:predicted HTH domain antitoxin
MGSPSRVSCTAPLASTTARSPLAPDGSIDGKRISMKGLISCPLTGFIHAMDVAFSMPEDLAQRLQAHWGDLSRRALEAVVADAYREETITLGEVRRLLGHSTRLETEAFLKSRGALLEYSEDELDADIQAAKEARR